MDLNCSLNFSFSSSLSSFRVSKNVQAFISVASCTMCQASTPETRKIDIFPLSHLTLICRLDTYDFENFFNCKILLFTYLVILKMHNTDKAINIYSTIGHSMILIIPAHHFILNLSSHLMTVVREQF